MLNIVQTEIKTGCLEKPVTLLHMTDLHLTYAGDGDDAYAHSQSEARRECFPSAHAYYKEIRDYIKAEAWDYAALTGDIIDFPSEENLSELERFCREDCGGKALYTLGNHDWSYARAYHTADTRAKYLPRFHAMTGGTPDFQTVDLGGLRLIGVDNSRNRFTEEQTALLKASMDKPFLLFFHVPLNAETLRDTVVRVWKSLITIRDDEHTDAATREFISLAARAEAIIAGHVHFWHEDEYAPGRMQYITDIAALGHLRRITLT